MTEERRNEIRLELRKNLILFGKTVMPKTFNKRSPDFHYELAELYHDKNEKLVNIIAPRHHAKSSLLAEAAPVHHLMFDPGQKVIVIISKTQGHAKDRLQAIKDLLNYGNEFRELFGNWGKETARKWTEDEIILKDGSAIICKGTGQQIIGLKRGHQRPTFVVLDDPEDTNNTKTKEAMDTNFSILLKGIMPGVDADMGRIFIIGTPQNELCMVIRVQTMPEWTSKEYSCWIDKENGIVLWPELWPHEKLKLREESYELAGTPSIFASEYECKIIGDEEQTFKKKYMKFWDGYHEVKKEQGQYLVYLHVTHKKLDYFGDWEKLEKEEIIPVNTFLGIDPAASTSQTADFTVAHPVGYDKSEELWSMPYFRKRGAPTEVTDGIIDKIKEVRPRRGGVETTAFQEWVREDVRKRMVREDCYVPGFGQEDGFKPRTKKNDRLLRLHPYFYRRQVWIHRDNVAFIDELLSFPRGKKDDTLDAFDYATKRLYPPNHTVVIKKKNEIFVRREQPKDWVLEHIGVA